MNLSQSYEFTDNSNFHNETGNDDNLGDCWGFKYNKHLKILNIILDMIMRIDIKATKCKL